jgi:hypothetical protein
MRVINMADVPIPTRAELQAHESAYRRGYVQGFYAAVEAARSGRVVEWSRTLDVLYAWRAQYGDGFTLPPDAITRRRPA